MNEVINKLYAEQPKVRARTGPTSDGELPLAEHRPPDGLNKDDDDVEDVNVSVTDGTPESRL